MRRASTTRSAIACGLLAAFGITALTSSALATELPSDTERLLAALQVVWNGGYVPTRDWSAVHRRLRADPGRLEGPLDELFGATRGSLQPHRDAVARLLRAAAIDQPLVAAEIGRWLEREQLMTSRRGQLRQTTAPPLTLPFARIEPGEFALQLWIEGAAMPTVMSSYEFQSHPVTQQQWVLALGENPSLNISDQARRLRVGRRDVLLDPDVPVNYFDLAGVVAFIAELHRRDLRHRYRIVSDAEWQFALTDRGRRTLVQTAAAVLAAGRPAENDTDEPYSVYRYGPITVDGQPLWAPLGLVSVPTRDDGLKADDDLVLGEGRMNRSGTRLWDPVFKRPGDGLDALRLRSTAPRRIVRTTAGVGKYWLRGSSFKRWEDVAARRRWVPTDQLRSTGHGLQLVRVPRER